MNKSEENTRIAKYLAMDEEAVKNIIAVNIENPQLYKQFVEEEELNWDYAVAAKILTKEDVEFIKNYVPPENIIYHGFNLSCDNGSGIPVEYPYDLGRIRPKKVKIEYKNLIVDGVEVGISNPVKEVWANGAAQWEQVEYILSNGGQFMAVYRPEPLYQRLGLGSMSSWSADEIRLIIVD